MNANLGQLVVLFPHSTHFGHIIPHATFLSHKYTEGSPEGSVKTIYVAKSDIIIIIDESYLNHLFS